MDSKVPGLGDTDQTPTTPDDEATQPEASSQPESEGTTDAAEQQPSADAVTAQQDEATTTEATASQQTSELASEPEATDAEETPREEPAAAPEPTQAEEASQPRLKRGAVVEGTITATAPTQVTVDLGEGQEGIIPGHELEKMNKSTLDSLREGEKVTVFVVNTRDHQGNIVLSVNRAMEELDWRRAEEYRQSQDVYETRVAGYNKGGLIVRFGRVRGFVPQSQMSGDRRRMASGETPEERWGKMVNEPISVKVMEVDRSRNRLILSERSATRESREKRKENLINQLKVGEVRTGRVVSLEDFGAFVDVGGAEGLVHLTELSWKHVTHPRELLKVGQEVRVEVISIDPEQKRIGLSIKSQEPDPWDMVAINYNVGQLVRASVTKLTKFGAFARLVDVPEIEGLIHISELSDRRVNHPREVVEEGDTLTLRVVKMDIANRRLGLSLKKVNSPEYLDQDWAMVEPASETAEASETVEAEAEVEEQPAAPPQSDAIEDEAEVEEQPAAPPQSDAIEDEAEASAGTSTEDQPGAQAETDTEDEADAENETDAQDEAEAEDEAEQKS